MSKWDRGNTLSSVPVAERYLSCRFDLMAAGRPGKNPLARYCWAPVEVANLRPGFRLGDDDPMRETVIS